MAYTPKPNSGALFKNNRKEKENQPDYQGDCFVGGVEYRIAVWLKKSQGGTPFMSLAFSPKEERRGEPVMDRGQQGGAGYGSAGLDDEVPFAPVRW